MPKNNFFERVYGIVRKIPIGKVTTYGNISRILGTKDARKVGWPRTELASSRGLRPRSRRALMRGKALITPRIVGFALHANHNLNVPCHRVVNKDGRLAPNFAFDGPEEQKRRLLAEGIEFKDEMHVDLNKHLLTI